MVASEVATEVAEEACAGISDEEYRDTACAADLESDAENLRRLVTALTHRVNRKRMLYTCLDRYKPRY